MGQKRENIPDPEDFTKEVELTIDDLFKPTKEIEIDPLTNEVKEVSEEQLFVIEPEPPEEEKDRAEDQEAEQVSTQEDDLVSEGNKDSDSESMHEDLLELDLKLELEPAEPESTAEPDESVEKQVVEEKVSEGPASDEVVSELSGLLKDLQQSLWTLEWEVTPENLSKVLKDIHAIKQEEIPNKSGRNILLLMEKVTQALLKQPDEVATTAPSTLKKAVEVLLVETGMKAAEKDIPDAKNIIDELEKALPRKAVLEKSHKPSQPPPIPGKTETQPKEVSSTVSSKAKDSKSSFSVEDQKACMVLHDHLKILSACVQKIQPVEKLLSQTSGMEKLYVFIKDLRVKLEAQCQAINELLKGKLPEIKFEGPASYDADAIGESAAEKRQSFSDSKGFPYEEVLVTEWMGRTVSLIPDEIVFSYRPPFWKKGAFNAAESISLKQLKPWPWSKLGPMFKGEFSEMDEAKLCKMELPVVKPPEKSSNQRPKGNHLVVLSKDGKSAILILDSEPSPISLPEGSDIKKSDGKGPWIGHIELDGQTIPVISVKNL